MSRRWFRSTPHGASTWPVSSVGLQEAIDAAAPRATITLCPGTWALTETVVIRKHLTLRGDGAGQSILDGGNAVRVLQVTAGANVTLQDLTITKGRAVGLGQIGGGIDNSRGAVTVDASALVCNNTPATDQCFNVANYPNLPGGTCPPV